MMNYAGNYMCIATGQARLTLLKQRFRCTLYSHSQIIPWPPCSFVIITFSIRSNLVQRKSNAVINFIPPFL